MKKTKKIKETEKKMSEAISELARARRMIADLKISMIESTARINQTSDRLLKRCSLERTNENTLPEEFVRACAEVRRLADQQDNKAFNCFGVADGDFPFYRKWKSDSYQWQLERIEAEREKALALDSEDAEQRGTVDC